jgi:PAS domain S-box-containing protein
MLGALLASLSAVTLLLLRLTRHVRTAEAHHLRLLRTLMDTIPCPIYYKDGQGRYLGFNRAYERYVGMSAEEMVGKTAHDLWPEELAATYENQDRLLREKPGTQIYEGPFIYADGSRHDVIFHKGSFRSADGRVGGTVGVIFDITERKAAEEETENSRQRLRDIIDFLPDATFVIDREGRVIAWNRSTEVMTGVRKEEVLGLGEYAYATPFYGEPRPMLIDLVDEDPDRVHPDYPFMKREGNTLYTQTLIPAIGGRESRYIWGTAAPLFDSRGNRVGAIESMRDITEYKRVENELRMKNLLQATQLEASIDGILAVDEHARILSWNRRFQEIFNLPKAALQSGTDSVALGTAAMERTEHPESFLEALRDIYRHPKKTSRDEILLKGGTVIDRYSAPMVDADGRYHGRVWYFRDITEQRHAEEVRSRFEAQRHHTQLMESFITRLGHDLRTPLTPLFVLIPLLLDRVADPELSSMLEICHQSALTVHQLTEKALKLVALSAPTGALMRTIELASQVDELFFGYDPAFREVQVSYENHVAAGLTVSAIPDQLRELLDNLLSNALRHSQAGGAVRVSARQAGETVTVSVQDEGEGLEPEELEQIFDEFYKVDRSRHDVAAPGLGLAICRKIVANHKGSIWAESVGKGCGLTVRFTLPAQ